MAEQDNKKTHTTSTDRRNLWLLILTILLVLASIFVFTPPQERINQLNDRIRRDEPKVKFADHVSDTVNLIDMNDMAKLCADHGIRIGRTRLFRWLRSKGILMEGNIPYQEYIERGYFKVKESVFDLYGEPKTYQQTMVTGRGQQYILARLMREYGTEVVNA